MTNTQADHSGENALPPFIITGWEKPSAGWLKVDVKDTTLGMTAAFYWCEYDDVGNQYTSNRTWAWRRWSMAGKPSVKLWHDEPATLTRLVREHPVLSLLADSFGIPQADYSGRNDPPTEGGS